MTPPDCIYAGPQVSTIGCAECGDTLVPVFACKIYGECTESRALPGLGCCNSCPARVAIPPVANM